MAPEKKVCQATKSKLCSLAIFLRFVLTASLLSVPQDGIEMKVKVREPTTASLRFHLEHNHDTIWADIRNKEKGKEEFLTRGKKRKAA